MGLRSILLDLSGSKKRMAALGLAPDRRRQVPRLVGGGGGEKRALTLWKSYLLSWRTNDAKLECLKRRGRMTFVNSVMSFTMKQSP
jgi:hypothetical protein